MNPLTTNAFLTTVNDIITQFEKSPRTPIMHSNMTIHSSPQQITILIHLLTYINNKPKLVNGKTNINCKMEYYYHLFGFIVITINNLYEKSDQIYNSIIDNFINKKLLHKLSSAHNGNILLQNLTCLEHFKIIYDNKIDILNINISYVCTCGTFETFVWWVGFLNNITIPIVSNGLINRLLSIPFKKSPDENILFINLLKSPCIGISIEELLGKSIINSDNRIFKYLLKEYHLNNQLITFTDEGLKKIINTLFIATFEAKYILKRLKLLSEYINIGHLFEYIISATTSTNVILTLHKFEYYYNKPHTFCNIADITFKLYLNNLNNENWYTTMEFAKAIKLFKTSNEQEMGALWKAIFNNIKNKYSPNDMDKWGLTQKYNIIINMIKWNQFEYIINQKTFIEKQVLYNRIISNIIGLINLLFTAESVKLSEEQMFIKLNKRLYFVRCAKRKTKRLKLNRHINNLSPLIIALKQRFNNLQFDNFIKKQQQMLYELNKNMYIIGNINHMRIIVLNSSCLSISHTHLKSSYLVKIIEFEIDNITIYGIIDIDIPHTTYDERYRFLLNIHPFKQTTKNTIDSLESYMQELKTDYENMIQYGNKNNDTISFLWWPLTAYKYTGVKQTICSDFIKKNVISSIPYYQNISIISNNR
jgi:hypothetical protein